MPDSFTGIFPRVETVFQQSAIYADRQDNRLILRNPSFSKNIRRTHSPIYPRFYSPFWVYDRGDDLIMMPQPRPPVIRRLVFAPTIARSRPRKPASFGPGFPERPAEVPNRLRPDLPFLLRLFQHHGGAEAGDFASGQTGYRVTLEKSGAPRTRGLRCLATQTGA